MNKSKSVFMSIFVLSGMLFILFTGDVSISAQSSDKRITDIRKIYDETNGLVAEMEKHPDLSTIFVVELVVNKYLSPYPAVGIYQSTATFYYTYGNREKDPYPNRLLKIVVELKRAANNGKFEYLFDPSGDLIFAFTKPDGTDTVEQRSYFSSRKLIKLTEDGKDRDAKNKDATEAGAVAKREAARLVGIFKASLRE